MNIFEYTSVLFLSELSDFILYIVFLPNIFPWLWGLRLWSSGMRCHVLWAIGVYCAGNLSLPHSRFVFIYTLPDNV